MQGNKNAPLIKHANIPPLEIQFTFHIREISNGPCCICGVSERAHWIKLMCDGEGGEPQKEEGDGSDRKAKEEERDGSDRKAKEGGEGKQGCSVHIWHSFLTQQEKGTHKCKAAEKPGQYIARFWIGLLNVQGIRINVEVAQK